MRAFEIINENDQKILKSLKWYYKVKQGRSGIGFDSHFKRLKETVIPHLSEHFRDPAIEQIIMRNLKIYSRTNPIVAIDIISAYDNEQEKLLIRIYDITNTGITSDRKEQESDRLVFDSSDDAEAFIMAVKLEIGDLYQFEIDNELEDIK